MRLNGTRTRPFALLLLGLAAGGAIIGGCSDDETPYVTSESAPAVNPPPISGGTLLIAKDGHTAVAADPDRDRVWIVDLDKRALTHEVVLRDGDEPGRVIEDGSGHVHVALRSSGALATIDLASGEITERRAVCPAPRGVAYEAAKDAVHVACAGGELVTLPAAGGKATRQLRLDRDLRDVLVDGDKLLVSRLKTAEVLVVNADGSIGQRTQPPSVSMIDFEKKERVFEPAVAWRMVQGPEDSVIVVHQRAATSPIDLALASGQAPYSPGPDLPCEDGGDAAPPPITHAALTTLHRASDGTLTTSTSFSRTLTGAALPVDVAISPSGTAFASVGAGTFTFIHASRTADGIDVPKPCDHGDNKKAPGQPTAVAFQDEDRLVVQLREPAALFFPADGTTLALPGESRFDTGHDVFHRAPKADGSIACASCHPEGHEDGRVWNFMPMGARRTQEISGGMLAAPLHWDGDMVNMSGLMREVLGRRMGGLPPGPVQMEHVERWIDALPALPRSEPVDAEAVARGEILFNDEAVGCATCHGGDKRTNNKSVDVGTGKEFQVPSLIGIAGRAPFMHDGCAPTLRARFDGNCGGGDAHGRTSQLSPGQIDDLVAYIETL
ncbi:c-type cytochrome [Polyangium aurulentum]|uniref:c-type cytochrome n=1 Tax=Polyangium aurulentum TaxID=2567896 RepID=UPI0010AEAA08|nr:cytochrome c [Polyangium aurulentum]UQA62847.1 c-type cytochrome [Polyangium aurulentum]